MHGLAHGVFGKGNFDGISFAEQLARHGEVFGQLLLAAQDGERREAASSGDHFEFTLGGGSHLQILQEAVRLDAGSELLDAVERTRLADVERRGD